MIKRIFLYGLILLPVLAGGQTNFFGNIRVEYEKTTSVRQLMKDMQSGSSWYEQNKDRYPVSMINYYEFLGDTTQSLYRPIKEAPPDPRSWYRPVGDKNIVFNDYRTETMISLKPVFEETFLLTDSFLRIKWKITNDLRTIAGFDCRKAIGTINDSIAVFAFYTDEILISGGPEGIHGLPGMILGVGIPRLHATWFATKVEVSNINLKSVIAPTRGKKVDRVTLMKRLGKLAEEWGSYGSKLLINFVI